MWGESSRSLCPIDDYLRITINVGKGDPHHMGDVQECPEAEQLRFGISAISDPQRKLQEVRVVEKYAQACTSNHVI